MADKAELAQTIKGLADLFGHDLTDELLGFYVAVLSPYPMGQVRFAVERIVATRKYRKLPLPSQYSC